MGDGGDWATPGPLHEPLAGRVNHQSIMAQKIYSQYRKTNGGKQESPLVLLTADRNDATLLAPAGNGSSTRTREKGSMRDC